MAIKNRALLRERSIERKGRECWKEESTKENLDKKYNKYVVTIRKTKGALGLVVVTEWAQLATPERTSWLTMALGICCTWPHPFPILENPTLLEIPYVIMAHTALWIKDADGRGREPNVTTILDLLIQNYEKNQVPRTKRSIPSKCPEAQLRQEDRVRRITASKPIQF